MEFVISILPDLATCSALKIIPGFQKTSRPDTGLAARSWPFALIEKVGPKPIWLCAAEARGRGGIKKIKQKNEMRLHVFMG
jgi:hypothetical protein